MKKNKNSSLINKTQEKFRLAEEELQIIFDSMPAWIFYKDKENRFIRVNKALAKDMGLSQEQLEGKSLFDLYPRDQAEAFWKDDQEVMLLDKSKTGIVESVEVAGRVRWLETDKVPYKDERGNIVGVIGFSVDITDIVDAEESLKRIMAKLADAEVKFSTIFNDSMDGVFLADVETGKFTLCNKMICSMLGYSEEELLQLSTADIYPQERLAQAREIFDKQACGEFQLAKELPVKRKDGSIFYADINSSPVSIMGKKYLMESFRDVTERRQAEAALCASEERFDLVVKGAQAGIWDYDIRSGKVFFSSTWKKLFGYAEEDIGESLEDWVRLLHPDEREWITKLQDDFLAGTESTLHVEYRLRYKDGSYRWISAAGIVVRDEQGKAIRFVGSHADITARKLAEEALQKSEELWRSVFAAANDSILVFDDQYRIVACNHMAEEVYGYSEQEFRGLSLKDIRSPNEVSFIEAQMQEAVVHQGARWQTIHRRKDASTFPVEISAKPFTVAGQLQYVNIVRDITEREKAREALEKANRDLMRLDGLKSNFVSVVSHELRTPLGITRESISQVLDGIQGEINQNQRKVLEVSLRNMDRLTRIIDNLLDISKIEAGKIELKVREVDISGLVRQVGIAFMPKIKEKGLELRLQLPQKINKVPLDYDRILQVFTNLLANSIKFTKEGFIEIAVLEKEGEIECSVSDSGIGISEEDLPKVFGKFQQFGQIERIGEKGTGLGLSIVKGIIDLHKGKIWVESELAKGSKFTFTLPKNKA